MQSLETDAYVYESLQNNKNKTRSLNPVIKQNNKNKTTLMQLNESRLEIYRFKNKTLKAQNKMQNNF